jgi:hypothetical protein
VDTSGGLPEYYWYQAVLESLVEPTLVEPTPGELTPGEPTLVVRTLVVRTLVEPTLVAQSRSTSVVHSEKAANPLHQSRSSRHTLAAPWDRSVHLGHTSRPVR